MKQTQKLSAKTAFTLAESGLRWHVITPNEKEIMSLRSGTDECRQQSNICAISPCGVVSFDDGRSRNKCAMTCDGNDMKVCKAAFTLAETLIALAVIGIVSALTIPGLVKNYNQKAWGHAQDVFSRKLDVALKEMNTEGTLTGYHTTEAFVNELKKNIKITRVCTGDKITNCFADKVVWNEGEDPIEITTSSVQFTGTADSDWAEPVGIQFVNGVNAIIGYNKNCYSDPYNNQYSPSSTCIGIMYDVSGFKKPNSNGKDIASNGNVALSGCAFKFTYGEKTVCFTKIVPPGSYEPLSYSECEKQKTALGLDYCYDGSEGDYFAGAAAVCGGKTKMANLDQLELLVKYLYETDDIEWRYADTSSHPAAFKANVVKTPFGDYYSSNSYFVVWIGLENNSHAAYWYFTSNGIDTDGIPKNYDSLFAVCSGEQSFYIEESSEDEKC